MNNQQLKEQNLNITKDDILMILKKTKSLPILSLQKRLSLFEQLVTMYHKERDFNLYEETIDKFYTNSFYLGKTKLAIEKSLAKTIKIIDIIAKYEMESQTTIPEHHAKYLFALVKEFINVIKKLVEKKEFEGDYKRLNQQLIWLKEIMLKAKNNGDIITVFDTVIRNIESANPLLLESMQENDESSLVTKKDTIELTAPLYKMTKKTYIEVLKNLYLYKEDDFYKILEHALSKFDENVLREAGLNKIPLYIMIMKKKYSKKLDWRWFSPQNMFLNKTADDIEKLSFYPLDCKDIDGFYNEYRLFLDSLQNDKIIGEVEKEFLNYRFLKLSHSFSKNLAKHFVRESEKIVEDVYSRLTTQNSTRLSELFNASFTYTVKDELLVLDTMSSSDRNGKIRMDLTLEKGEIKAVWKGKTVKVDDKSSSFRQIEVPRGKMTLTEFHVVEDIQMNIIDALKKYINDPEIHVSKRFLERINWFDDTLLELEFDTIVENEVKQLRWRSAKKNLFLSRLLKRKFENHLVIDSELELIMNSEVMIENASFELIDTKVVLSYLQKAIDKGFINPVNEKELVKLFTIKIDDKKAKEAYIYQILRKYHTEMTLYLTNLVELDIESKERSVEERRNSLVYNYYTEKLAKQGYKSENHLF